MRALACLTCSGLLLLAGQREVASQTTARVVAPGSAILLALSADGTLDTVCVFKGGKYLHPTDPSLEGTPLGSVMFEATYFSPGRSFHVIFGGAAAGSAQVLPRPKESELPFTAPAALTTTAPIRGSIQGLATDRLALADPVSTRRAARPKERSAALAIANRIFAARGISAKDRARISVLNLTAGDLDADRRSELVGNFQVRRNGCAQNLFLLLEPRGSGRYHPALAFFHESKDTFGTDRQEQELLDWLDLNRDGTRELVTISYYYESWDYKIYSRARGKWSRVYHGPGSGS